MCYDNGWCHGAICLFILSKCIIYSTFIWFCILFHMDLLLYLYKGRVWNKDLNWIELISWCMQSKSWIEHWHTLWLWPHYGSIYHLDHNLDQGHHCDNGGMWRNGCLWPNSLQDLMDQGVTYRCDNDTGCTESIFLVTILTVSRNFCFLKSWKYLIPFSMITKFSFYWHASTILEYFLPGKFHKK